MSVFTHKNADCVPLCVFPHASWTRPDVGQNRAAHHLVLWKCTCFLSLEGIRSTILLSSVVFHVIFFDTILLSDTGHKQNMCCEHSDAMLCTCEFYCVYFLNHEAVHLTNQQTSHPFCKVPSDCKLVLCALSWNPSS